MGQMILFFSALFALLVVSCGKSESGTSGVAQPNYTWIQSNVLDRSCVACHNKDKHPKNVNLSSYDAIVASKVVTPGDAAKSTLFTEIDTGQMPLHAPALPKDISYAVRDWIASGAAR